MTIPANTSSGVSRAPVEELAKLADMLEKGPTDLRGIRLDERRASQSPDHRMLAAPPPRLDLG
jgi:hypothetical protein